jgi:hypothetical protein
MCLDVMWRMPSPRVFPQSLVELRKGSYVGDGRPVRSMLYCSSTLLHVAAVSINIQPVQPLHRIPSFTYTPAYLKSTAIGKTQPRAPPIGPAPQDVRRYRLESR